VACLTGSRESAATRYAIWQIEASIGRQGSAVCGASSEATRHERPIIGQLTNAASIRAGKVSAEGSAFVMPRMSAATGDAAELPDDGTGQALRRSRVRQWVGVRCIVRLFFMHMKGPPVCHNALMLFDQAAQITQLPLDENARIERVEPGLRHPPEVQLAERQQLVASSMRSSSSATTRILESPACMVHHGLYPCWP
jgi:hypothetical protein